MAGIPVTQEELKRAQEILGSSDSISIGMGRLSLARAMGITEARARSILEYVRHPSASKKITSYTAAEGYLEDRKLEMENNQLRTKLSVALSRQVLDQRYQEFVAEVAAAKREYPKWVVEAKSGQHTAMPFAHLSDAHFDEVVDPKQVFHVNGYNREIAVRRLRRFFEKTITIPDEYLKGVVFPGLVLAISGDMFSGNIHEELRETNESTITESIRFWLDEMATGIELLADRYGKVFVPCVVGNHGRLTRKPIAKNGPTDSFDWLLYSLLQRDFARAKDDRVQFQIAESFDNYFRVFNTRYCQTHGDQFRGGSGISGNAIPLAIGDARKRKRSQTIKLPYDYIISGHRHTRETGRVVKQNGSLKGFDEYSLRENFDAEPPTQSFWLDTPEHKITLEMPIFVKCEKEGWERKQTEAQAIFEAA